MLVIITSPHRKAGLAYDLWRDHYGKDDADILVVRGPSTAFNPTLNPKIIEAALARVTGMRGWREYADRAVAVYEALPR